MDAPKRIWAQASPNDHTNPATEDWSSGWWHGGADSQNGVEYIRADTLPAIRWVEGAPTEKMRDGRAVLCWLRGPKGRGWAEGPRLGRFILGEWYPLSGERTTWFDDDIAGWVHPQPPGGFW